MVGRNPRIQEITATNQASSQKAVKNPLNIFVVSTLWIVSNIIYFLFSQEFGSLDAGKNRPPPYIKQWASKLLRGNKRNSIGNLSDEEKPTDTFNNYLTHTGIAINRNNSLSPERSNSTNDIDMNSLLEETSIADLIRKLKSLERYL